MTQNLSRKHHSFDTELAKQYGLEEAILIHQFQYWLKPTRNSDTNFINGRRWTPKTLEEIAAHFDYMTKDKIRRYIESLVTQEVLLKGNYNDSPLNKTSWYAFKNEEMFTKRNAVHGGVLCV